MSKIKKGHRGWNWQAEKPEEVRDSQGSTSDHLSSHGMNHLEKKRLRNLSSHPLRLSKRQTLLKIKMKKHLINSKRSKYEDHWMDGETVQVQQCMYSGIFMGEKKLFLWIKFSVCWRQITLFDAFSSHRVPHSF